MEFAIKRGLLHSSFSVDFARDWAASSASLLPNVDEIAAAASSGPSFEQVQKLASSEPPSDPNILNSKWLYLALAWLFEHRSECPDPLDEVAALYSDFGYPSEIEHFVRYMPMVGPRLGSHTEYARRLYEYWKRYLVLAAERFHP